MPDFAAGFMNMLKNGPGPLPPEQKAQVDAWLEQKRAMRANTMQGTETADQMIAWQKHDKAKYEQHMHELATHAAAAEAVSRSKTMLIGLLGLSSQANKVTPPERSTNRQQILEPFPK